MAGMETGKVKHTIRDRAILKKTKTGNRAGQAVPLPFSEEGSSGCILEVSDTIAVPIHLLEKGRSDYIKVQIEDILNRLYVSLAVPAAMTALIMLPEQTEETYLRFLVDCLVQKAEQDRIKISDIEAECSPDVGSALLMLTVFGKREQELCLQGREAFLPGQELIMIGTAAAEGTVMLENAGREALQQRFSRRFLENVRSLSSKTGIRNKMELVRELAPAGVYCVGRSGIFGALWEIAAFTGKGFSVELGTIPICQETIEICEFFDVNPYMLRSGGVLLVAANQGRRLVERCRGCGIEAAVIGSMEDHADKLVRNGEECRYLTMPAAVRLGQNQPEGLFWIY